MELVGFDRGDPRNEMGVGRYQGLFAALRALGAVHDTVDVEIRGQERYLLTAREFSLRRRRWHHNLQASPHLFNARSDLATQYLRDRPSEPDAILQAGAQFDATRDFPHLPRFCYLDSTCTLRGHSIVNDNRPGYDAHERERRIYAQSAGLFTTSADVRQSLIADFGVQPEKVHVVYRGVDIPCPSPGALARREPIVLFIGRDFERTGGALLLRAFARVHRVRPNTRLFIAGCHPRVKQRGVHVVGGLEAGSPETAARLASLYARASVFHVPGQFSGFPVHYAEAMHYGVPCVGTQSNTLSEMLVHGVSGILVPPNDEIALADALTSILQSRRVVQQLGEAGARRAANLFRWDLVAAKMLSVMSRKGNVMRAAARAA